MYNFLAVINELALKMINNGNHVAAFAHDFMKIFILLFADDIVLMSETVVGLKNLWNI